MGRKKAKMRNKNTVSLYSLSKTERLFIEQQGKAMDRTSQYCHYYHCNRQENKDREDDKDAEGYNEAEGVFEEGQTGHSRKSPWICF